MKQSLLVIAALGASIDTISVAASVVGLAVVATGILLLTLIISRR